MLKAKTLDVDIQEVVSKFSCLLPQNFTKEGEFYDRWLRKGH